jgi:hypothetical protein
MGLMTLVQLRRILGLSFCAFMFSLTCSPLRAQDGNTIVIRIINGKNGRPLPNQTLQVWVDHSDRPETWIQTDENGVGTLKISPEASVIFVSVDSHVDCNSKKEPAPNPFRHWYAVSEILKSGLVAPNNCSKQSVDVKAREFVFFVRPPTLREKWQR